jgi:hypothetical protein
MFDVRFEAEVFRSTLVVLAKIFDGSLLDWHRKMSRRIAELSAFVNIWYTQARLPRNQGVSRRQNWQRLFDRW